MGRALLLDPFSGISGDMFLGALVDVGAPFEALKETVMVIPEMNGVRVERESVRRGAILATRINVECPRETAHRSLSTIREILGAADLKEEIRQGAIRTFTKLAAAEAKVHGQSVEDIHFHEVGALDAIFDIVGAHVGLDLLGNPSVFTRPLVLGSGEVDTEHGRIPVPVPATVELLSGFPITLSEAKEELVTPTGAAIVASMGRPLSSSAMVTLGRVGYGAGSRESEGLPNVLRAMLCNVKGEVGRVGIVTSTIDDMNPEMYGYLMDKLFAAGALEVYYNPVLMKKNRPGVEITLIVEEGDIYKLTDILLTTSTTLGVRVHREERIELSRKKAYVDTPYGSIQVKIAERPDGTASVSPEYESCRAAAEESNASILDVYDSAKAAWRKEER